MNTIQNIKFIEHGGRYGQNLGMFMPGHYWVPAPEIDLTWIFATAHLDKVDWTKKVYAETVFTKDVWCTFTKHQKHCFGRSLKYFTVQGMLPIEVANPNKKGKRFYKLKA